MGQIIIDPAKIKLGESTSEWVADRGFSPDSYGLNLTYKRGALFFVDGGTQRGSAVLTGNIICSAYDKNLLGNDAYFLDDEGAFYYYSGTTLTKAQTSTADTFQLGTSDMLQFQGSTYATGQTRVVQLGNSNLTTIDSSWWTGLTTSYRHPLERVEDKMYIGDVNLIHTWDGTTSTSAAITLPTDVNITSLRKHPDGRTLLAFCGLTANFSHTKGLGGRVYYVDIVTKRWTREVELDVQVEGSRVAGGIVYVTYGNNVGYFTGDGVTFLKKLVSATTYSHCLASMEDILLVRDNKDILAFGDLGAGKVWWRTYRNNVNTQPLNFVCYKGDNMILTGSSDGASGGVLSELDLDNVGLAGLFYTNREVLPGEAQFKRFVALHDLSATAGTTRFQIIYRDHANFATNVILDREYLSQSVIKTQEDIDVKTDLFQAYISPQNDDIGFYFLKFEYDLIE